MILPQTNLEEVPLPPAHAALTLWLNFFLLLVRQVRDILRHKYILHTTRQGRDLPEALHARNDQCFGGPHAPGTLMMVGTC